LVLNTYRTGIDVGELCHNVWASKQELPMLHIGSTIPDGLPDDVPTLAEDFTAETLLLTVRALVEPGPMSGDPASIQPQPKILHYPNGRRREDLGPRRVATPIELPGKPTAV
jgi:hypothetical protein